LHRSRELLYEIASGKENQIWWASLAP
jgi:hypothetical protein